MPRSLSTIASATSGVGIDSFGRYIPSEACAPKMGLAPYSAERRAPSSAVDDASHTSIARDSRSCSSSPSSLTASARAANSRASATAASSPAALTSV